MRKKLFAIVMSMTMVASFMPSLAFADTSHVYAAGNPAGSEVTWTAVKTSLEHNTEKDYVTVVKAPTCTEDGVAKLACMTDYCDEVKEVTIKKLNHADAVDTAMSTSEYVDALVAQGDLHKSDAAQRLAELEGRYCSVVTKKCPCGHVGVVEAASIEHQRPSALVGKDCATSFVCTKCSATVETGTDTEHHSDTTKEVVVAPADCGHDALVETVCTVCGEKYTFEKASEGAKTNKCKYANTVSATNTKTLSDGTVEYYIGDVSIAKVKDHAATNVAKGYYVDASFDTPVIYKYDTVVKKGNCTTGDKVGFKCTVCGKVNMEVTLDAPSHDWETKEIAATCVDPVQLYKVCKVCGKFAGDAAGTTVKDTLEDAYKADKPGSKKLGHNCYVTKVDATCTSSPYYVIKCSNCDLKDTKSASLFADGISRWLNPSTGGVSKSKTEGAIELPVIKVNETAVHKYTKRVTLKAASCENAEVVGYKCDNCGKINAHGEGAFAVTTVGQPLAHNFVKTEVAPTCSADGYYIEKCSSCGKYKKNATEVTDNESEALHTKTTDALVGPKADCKYDKWVVTKDATVFEEGVKSLSCSVCGTLHDTKAPIAKKAVAKASNTVKAGKKSFNVKSSAANATGYRVYYKKAGAKSWKSYTKKTASLSKTFSGLSKGKYYVKVKAYAKNYAGDGQVVWGATSSTKSVKVK